MGLPITDIPCALQELERNALAGAAAGHSYVLEVGALLGGSTVLLAKNAHHVVSVDPHEGYPEHNPQPTYQTFIDNLYAYGVRDKVTVITSRVQDVILTGARRFGLIFIDATGKYKDTQEILEHVAPWLEPWGTLAVHDYGRPDWPGVRVAVDEWRRFNPWYSLVVINHLAILRRSFLD